MINYDIFKDYNYISFDLFDTLIFRTFTSYKKIYEFVQYQYCVNKETNFKHFVEDRVAAEKKARKRKKYKEVNIEEIYKELPYSLEKKEVLKELEQNIEVQSSIPNMEMITLLNKLRDEGKKIVITTDMYLSQHTIESILIKNNINYDYLFISGKEKKTKQEGSLFLCALKKIGINKDELIHIGDNPDSDYSVPNKIGINAVLYKRDILECPYLLRNQDIIADHYNSIICNGLYNIDQVYKAEYILGFSVMGPVISSFCQWIHDVKQENKLDKILFLAREGYAIQNVYKILFPEDKQCVHYARINKHILRLPLLTNDNFSDLLKSTLKNSKKVSWRYVLESLDIEDVDCIKFPKGQSLDSEILLKDLDNIHYDVTKRNIINQLSAKISYQEELLNEYLNDFDMCNCKVGLVNNSYSGNGQKLLTEFCKQKGMKLDILGIQFAANKICKQVLENRVVAWMNDNDDSMMAYLFERASLIFEHLLFEPQGTAVKLDRDEKGKAFVVCEQTRTEQEDFERIAACQAGMLDFAKHIKNNVDCSLGSKSMNYFVNLIQNPTKEDALLLGNLHDDDADIDRLINNYSNEFRLCYLYKNNIYNQVSWVQGFLKVKEKPELFRKLFNFRLFLTYYWHKVRGEL